MSLKQKQQESARTDTCQRDAGEEAGEGKRERGKGDECKTWRHTSFRTCIT